ncbi:MAG: hypothetical protein AB4368_04225 [Xenococcaceae cyanobacterium]
MSEKQCEHLTQAIALWLRLVFKRSPEPKVLPNVACDRMTYFTTEAGLKELVDALYR